MSVPEGALTSEVQGTIVRDGKVLVIRRIEVTYHLEVPAEQREAVDRVLDFHADFCPVARTLRGCVEISTRLAGA